MVSPDSVCASLSEKFATSPTDFLSASFFPQLTGDGASYMTATTVFANGGIMQAVQDFNCIAGEKQEEINFNRLLPAKVFNVIIFYG
jgi:hypothetical protein